MYFAVYSYAPRGLAQPDMKSGPGHVANQGAHPHQPGVTMNPYGPGMPIAVPPISIPHNPQMMPQPRGSIFMMSRGQPGQFNTVSDDLSSSALGIEPRLPKLDRVPGSLGYHVLMTMLLMHSVLSYSVPIYRVACLILRFCRLPRATSGSRCSKYRTAKAFLQIICEYTCQVV